VYDVEETKRRGYSGKSKVYFDGRERLYGKDWAKRKKEVWERGGGRCERIVGECVSYDKGYPYLNGMEVRCRSEMHDPHHIVKRSKKRDDRLEALIGLCRLHHDLLDERKPRWSKREVAA
jgi:hypothetical protein